MSVIRSAILGGVLASLAYAFTEPTTASWGPLLTPNLGSPVTQGETYTITWDPESHPTDGVTVSLVLCSGPSSNCVTAPSAIIEGVPAAAKSYSWAVPCSLAPGTASTDSGHGLLIIVDGTGEFQYSTQFSVLANPKCSSNAFISSSTTASVSIATTSSNSTSTSLQSEGWTSIIGPGQGGYSNKTSTTSYINSTTTGRTISASTSTGSAYETTSIYQTSTSALATSPISTTSTAGSSATSGAGVTVEVGNAGVLSAVLLAGAGALFAF
ncbi:hypothetical protein DV736_g3232, partial [Chaetothyriales sp. CBS 134916]